MKKVFIVGDVVVAWGMVYPGQQVVMAASHPQAQSLDVDDETAVDVGWKRVTVVDRVAFIAPPPSPPTVGPNEFYFLWTLPEQEGIEELRETVTGIKLFMRRLDDPRTTEVVLADTAVQEAITLTVGKLVERGTIDAADAPDRIAAIISGVKR